MLHYARLLWASRHPSSAPSTTGSLHRRSLCPHATPRHHAPLASHSCHLVRDAHSSSPTGSSRFRTGGAAPTLCPAPRRGRRVHGRPEHWLPWPHVARGTVRLGHPDVERPRENTGSLSAAWRCAPRVRRKPRSNRNSCRLGQGAPRAGTRPPGLRSGAQTALVRTRPGGCSLASRTGPPPPLEVWEMRGSPPPEGAHAHGPRDQLGPGLTPSGRPGGQVEAG